MAQFHGFDTISIHSPHARGDAPSDRRRRRLCHFNPLPSCEGRQRFSQPCVMLEKFQSTPLMRGETENSVRLGSSPRNFNPLPSCEGRRCRREWPPEQNDISIHSPHARGDASALFMPMLYNPFQSTPLMRGETKDTFFVFPKRQFQSTPLMRGETISMILPPAHPPISIHSPHARGDTSFSTGA